MNIDLKEYNFRFIFPAAIFLLMSLLLFPEKVADTISLYGKSIGDSLFVALAAVVSGLAISALGGLFISVIDHFVDSPWACAKREYDYWKKLGEITADNEFLRAKVQRRWEYFVANFNAALAYLVVLIIDIFICSSDTALVKSFMMCLIVVHVYHAAQSYKAARKFAEMVGDKDCTGLCKTQ